MAPSFRMSVEESLGASLRVLGGLVVVEQAITEYFSVRPCHCEGVRHARINHELDIRHAR